MRPSMRAGLYAYPTECSKTINMRNRGERVPATLTEVSHIPDPADDLCAYIRFINAPLFPTRFSELRAHEILIDGPEGHAKIAQPECFITGVINSPFWGEWWERARNNDSNALRTMVREVAVWP